MKRIFCLSLLFCLLCGCHQVPEQMPTVNESALVPTASSTVETESTQPESVQDETAPAEEIIPSEETSASTEPEFDPYTLVYQMSVEELVGQLFLARCPSGSTAIADIRHLSNEVGLGLFTLMGFKTFSVSRFRYSRNPLAIISS